MTLPIQAPPVRRPDAVNPYWTVAWLLEHAPDPQAQPSAVRRPASRKPVVQKEEPGGKVPKTAWDRAVDRYRLRLLLDANFNDPQVFAYGPYHRLRVSAGGR
jgi:hypothetical protein